MEAGFFILRINQDIEGKRYSELLTLVSHQLINKQTKEFPAILIVM